MSLPADNLFVDENRRIVETWRKVFLALDPVSSLTADEVAALRQLIAAAANPVPNPGSFGEVDAFNESSPAGKIIATQSSDTVSVNMGGSGNIFADQASKDLLLSIGTYSAVIPDTGVYIVPMGFFGTGGGTVPQDVIIAIPLNIPSRRLITTIGWRDSASAGGNFEIGLYTDLHGKPGFALVRSGTIAYAGGTTNLQTATTNITVSGGTYWILITFSAAAAAFCMTVAGSLQTMGSDPSTFTAIKGWRRNAVFDGMLDDETASVWTFDTSITNPLVFAG